MAKRKTYKADRLRALLRWDISWNDFWEAHIPPIDPDVEDYTPNLDDIKALLDNMERRNPTIGELHDEWGMIYSGFAETYGDDDDESELLDELYDHIDIEYDDFIDSDNYIDSPEEAIAEILDAFMYLVGAPETYDIRVMDGIIDIPRLRKDIADIENGDLSTRCWKWTDFTKLRELGKIVHNRESNIGEDEYDEAVEILEELCYRGVIPAIELKAYGCYGGCDILPCNWEMSRDTLQLLIDSDVVEDTAKGFYSNTLGYIYYYGRCSNGKPEYDKALQYFTIGAAMGIAESQYKIADMIRDGKGVPKNEAAYITLISRIFESTRKDFTENTDDTPTDYPDAALRLGSLLEEHGEIYQAYRTFREGLLALAGRDEYGDGKVEGSLQRKISEIEKNYPIVFSPQGESRSVKVLFYPLEQLVSRGTVKGEILRKGDQPVIGFTSTEGPMKIFVIIPGYAGIMNEAIYNIESAGRFHIARNASSFLFDTFTVTPAGTDETGARATIVFKRDGKVTASIESANIGIMIPPEN